jgi:hypothetical protein
VPAAAGATWAAAVNQTTSGVPPARKRTDEKLSQKRWSA